MRRSLLIFVLLRLINVSQCLNVVPVVIYDPYGVTVSMRMPINPLEKKTTDYFVELLNFIKIKVDNILIFIEEHLSTEDISSKDDDDETVFEFLKEKLDAGQIYFVSSVSNVYDSITEIFPESQNYTYIYFSDNVNNDRIQTLRAHDELLKTKCVNALLNSNASFVAIYTGKRNVEELNRVPKNKTESVILKVASPGGALYNFHDFVVTNSSHTTLLGSDFDHNITAEDTYNSDFLVSIISLDDYLKVEFNFSFLKSYWTLDSVGLYVSGELVGLILTTISVPWGRSYYCAEPLSIRSVIDENSITFNEYQIEPYRSMVPDIWNMEPLSRSKRKSDGAGGNGASFVKTIDYDLYEKMLEDGALKGDILEISDVKYGDDRPPIQFNKNEKKIVKDVHKMFSECSDRGGHRFKREISDEDKGDKVGDFPQFSTKIAACTLYSTVPY